jgi:exopolysaccharide biosynthesis predicted pyruvyltransferase EpsI
MSRSRVLVHYDEYRFIFEPFIGKRIGYVRMNGNVGDRLIDAAAMQAFEHFGIDYRISKPHYPGDIDEWVIAGGGNMGTRYRGSYMIRQRVLKDGRPVTVLPQSFTDFESNRYKAVYVRERASLERAGYGILAPDMALCLQVDQVVEAVLNTGVWLRADAEGRFSSHQCRGDPAKLCDTWQKYFDLAARHKSIVTDRLHFAISGLLAGREVTLLPNRYWKNRSMYDTWLKDLGCRWREAP